MTDTVAAPLTPEEEAQLAELSQRKAAAAAAEKAQALAAMHALVASDTIAKALSELRTAAALNLGEADLTYAIGCLQRLGERYAA